MGVNESKLTNPHEINLMYDKIKQERTKLDQIYKSIDENAKLIENEINKRGLDEKFCKNIAYIKTEELNQFLTERTIKGIAYKIGIIDDNEDIKVDRKKVCEYIINFFKDKIIVAKQAQEYGLIFQNGIKNVYNFLEPIKEDESIPINIRKQIYQQVMIFTNNLEKIYNEFLKYEENIRNVKNVDELEEINEMIRKKFVNGYTEYIKQLGRLFNIAGTTSQSQLNYPCTVKNQINIAGRILKLDTPKKAVCHYIKEGKMWVTYEKKIGFVNVSDVEINS